MLKRLVFLLKRPRHWVNFRMPIVRQLHCLPLVVENKLLFLVAWDAKFATDIHLKPIRRTYLSATGAAICRLPPGTETVEVIVRNLWRRKKIVFPLQTITVDPAVLQAFYAQLTQRIGITQPSFDYIPKTAIPTIAIKPFSLSFHHPQFEYFAP